MVKIKTDRFKLSELRIRQGMLGTDLASKVGVTKQNIYAIEKGRTNPNPALAKKITEVLNVPFDTIFSLVEGE
jgi:DNA-binding XRE family transcriptional regulator